MLYVSIFYLSLYYINQNKFIMSYKNLEYINRSQAKKITGLTYLGATNSSAKIMKNAKKGEDTYIVYLAPADMSGHNVCPGASDECRAACLNESGHNKIDTNNKINQSRINKTKLFYENRKYFMKWLVEEITVARTKAEKNGQRFSVRLNGTSDISPLAMKLDGKNILEIFPDVQFYDYTKVLGRVNLLKKYTNYDLTFSYNGNNWDECLIALDNDMRVAVVFEKDLPKEFEGIQVVNGDEYDMRYIDPKKSIIGLKFKYVRTKIDFELSSFIIAKDDNRSKW